MMAFEKAMKMMGKPPKREKEPKGTERPEPKAGKVEGEEKAPPEHEGGESSTTTIEHHPDGSHSIDGEHHPTHLHMLAALGHKVTGGDKHHIAHHDGMQIHTHGIHETGEHEEGGTHNSAEEAAGAMSKFLGEEAQEPIHQGGGEKMGGMGAY